MNKTKLEETKPEAKMKTSPTYLEITAAEYVTGYQRSGCTTAI